MVLEGASYPVFFSVPCAPLLASRQDEAHKAAGGRHRAAVLRQVAEKKASLLERALEHCPDSDSIALLYLATCRSRQVEPVNPLLRLSLSCSFLLSVASAFLPSAQPC